MTIACVCARACHMRRRRRRRRWWWGVVVDAALRRIVFLFRVQFNVLSSFFFGLVLTLRFVLFVFVVHCTDPMRSI